MRQSSLSRWLQSLRTRPVTKPRKAALGLNTFEARDMPSASVIACPVVEVAHAKVCGSDNHGSKVSEVAKTIGDKDDCGVKPPKSTPCNDGSNGKGSADKCQNGSSGKGSGGKCQGSSGKGSNSKGSNGKGSKCKGSSGKGSNNKGSSGKGSNCKGSSGKGSNNKGSSGKCNVGSSGKGSNNKGSSGKCNVGSSGKGSNNKGSSGKCDNGSSGKGSNCKPSHDKCDTKVKGNNGVGNGLDPQPPGDPRVNDGAGTSPGSPGNKGKK
jgi:hypothetical protein